jgi:hypothetical protein
MVAIFEVDGFVVPVPLDDFMQIGHVPDNSPADLHHPLYFFNIHLIEQPDLFLQQTYQQFLQ